MFWSAKKEENRHIIAVKDYANTAKSIKEGTFYVPYNKENYIKLFETNSTKIDTVKELGKFMKDTNKVKGDVKHYWDSLIGQGYSLINVLYVEKTPSIDKLCFNDTIKYISDVNFNKKQ